MALPIFGIVGAAGVVGKQIVAACQSRGLEPEQLRLFGSERNAGEEVDYDSDVLPIEPVGPDSFRGLSAAIVATPLEVAKGLALQLQKQGAWVVDCSGAFRVDLTVPLVVPGVNDGVLDRPFSGRIVSLAHPATQGVLSVLEPLREKWGLATADITVLGGAALFGHLGVERLSRQAADLMNGKDPDLDTFPHRLAFNVIPAIGPMESGLAQLERHLLIEAARVWSGETLPALTATSVLVPTYHGLTILITAHLQQPVDAEQVRAQLKAGGSELKLLDQPEENIYPMPMLVTDDASIHVGRVRAHLNRVQLVAALDNAVRLADSAVELATELVLR
jgi:aspartate-semialdehyde dehydrogenase